MPAASNSPSFGMVITDRTFSSASYRYGFNGKEKDDEVNVSGGSYDFGARLYDSRLGRWLSIDPLCALKPSWSSYESFMDNPNYWIDPTGLTEAERKAAVAKAKEWAKANNEGAGDTYVLGAKGKEPGESIDCSGLITRSIEAAGLKDPVATGSGGGVERIVAKSRSIELNEVREGDLLTFNTTGAKYSHVGIVTNVVKDSQGNVTSVTIIHSGGTPGSGKSGPMTQTIDFADKSANNWWYTHWTGTFAWDTPDPNENKTSDNTSVVYYPFKYQWIKAYQEKQKTTADKSQYVRVGFTLVRVQPQLKKTTATAVSNKVTATANKKNSNATTTTKSNNTNSTSSKNNSTPAKTDNAILGIPEDASKEEKINAIDAFFEDN